MLSPRALEVLALMAKHKHTTKGELVTEGIVGYLGSKQVAVRTAKQLHLCCAVDDTAITGETMRRYVISSVGEAILRRPILADEILIAIYAGKKFSVKDDKIVELKDQI